MFLDPALGAMSERDGGKLNRGDFYESIYFVLCVINVNSELKAALSPMGIGDTATHTDLHRFSGIYIAWNNTALLQDPGEKSKHKSKCLTKINL